MTRSADQSADTILLVEDEFVVRDITREVLEMAGYRVFPAESPERAIKLTEQHRGSIDLLLTDLVMPGMNGSDLSRRLQLLQPGLTTVYMSGYAEHDVERNIRREPGSPYIRKPFTIDILLSGVANAIANSRTSQRVRGCDCTRVEVPILPGEVAPLSKRADVRQPHAEP